MPKIKCKRVKKGSKSKLEEILVGGDKSEDLMFNENNSDNESLKDDDDAEEENYDDDIEADDEEDSLKDDIEVDDEEDNKSNTKIKKKGDTCFYEYADSDEEDYDSDSDVSDDEEIKVDNKYIDNEHRITRPILYHYEYVRLLTDRSKQLSLGAKSTVKGTQGMNPKEVAKLEIENKVVPLLIERELPNGKIEKWNIRELTHIDFF